MMEMEDGRPLHELRFDAAVKVIQSLPPDGPFQPSNDMMLRFYSYYKQATLGPCSIPRPGFWDPVGKVKWDAWSDLGDMTKEEAMTAYVDEMKLILEGMPCTDEVEQLLKVLGPFYEQVEEKKQIHQVSDLSAGFGTMLTSAPSKSVTKSLIRTMEMNGTLETRKPRQTIEPPEPKVMALKEQGEEEEFEFDEEDEMEDGKLEIVAIKEVKKASAPQPEKNGSSRRPKVPLSNGNVWNGVGHLPNGTHTSKAALNSEDSEEGLTNSTLPLEPHVQVNGHHADLNADVFRPYRAASDSDSEVYCDSMDQFGLEEGSEAQTGRCLELDEEHGEKGETSGGDSVTGIQCGAEDGETCGGASQRLNAGRPNSSLVGRERGSRSSGHSPGAQKPLQGSGGDGERWGGAGTRGGSLNEQIVVALARLQEDMQHVLDRLHTLEALTASQARSPAQPYPPSPLAKKNSKKPSWWPFNVSPSTVAFAVVWPFVVQWLIRRYLQRRRRRIN
ncbi:acyl-CoA-binding domain-containing protein 5A-like isoform X1 [Salvelinus fontinalis]|uniref:acyl-CoA-binding domain-containing protein 5A-like isoform X1 n=3 Tax=Salvelinus fontinalis TaxID=8038 RepID=UPI00248556C8|nr:acyl-CoA-binding domain-containing protein 5A-like isoform X1 [Salvelinus fontinalis]